ncbi:MAG: L,D-transpeptidase family protein [Candidatus Riflebacteria bacterium]|nr:L,D-transpeptidase family protein [Candidatus Riflebacteria bacterium]
MRQTVTLLGDYFFYAFSTLSIICILAVITTPARSFIIADLYQQLDKNGKERALASFAEKLARAGVEPASFSPQLLIRKRSRELLVLSDDSIIASYPIGLGRSPVGIKLRGNDQKTPEGQYYICKKLENHRYHLFLQINYPSPDDAKRGSVQQIIKPGEEARIEAAWQQMQPPPTDTALGGPLGIHGFGAETNWTTDGSIGLHNIHIEELYWNLATGTPVAIIP